MKKFVLIASSIFFLVACAATKSGAEAKVDKNVSELSDADVSRVQTKFPGYTLADLKEGKELYENNCALCHGLKKLDSQTEEGWRNVVPPMVKKANNKVTNKLDAAAEEKILRYVITMGPELKN